MPFSEATIKAAWERFKAVCECRNPAHGHGKRCSTRLLWTLQGGELGGAAWRPYRKTPWGTDGLENCEIRCTRCQGPLFKPFEWEKDLKMPEPGKTITYVYVHESEVCFFPRRRRI
jgi:hypothetical protein